jgi:osmoprotectant transport system ATP-binding protein
MTEPMIDFGAVGKAYDGRTVVSDLTLAIPAGAFCVLLGPSGCGKSTTLRMINRLVPFDSGTIRVGGENVLRIAPEALRRRIGYAIQSTGLFPHWRVADNIATVPRLLGWEEARVRARVDELLQVFQLDPREFAGKFPHQLSGGQQQRVGVARALAAEPAVLLMDEPFGALDPIIRAKAQDDLLDIQRRFGTTIVLVTHDMDEAFRLGNRVAVMSQGRVLQYDRPAVLLTRPADPFVSRMTGIADRAMKLLSLTTVGEAALPGTADGPAIAASASLRDALSELVWRGAEAAPVINPDGAPCGCVTIAAILAHGRPG